MAASLTPSDLIVLQREIGPAPWPVTDLYARGWARGVVRHALDTGVLARVRRGLVAPGSERAAAGPDVVRFRAALRAGGEGAALSHCSAGESQGVWLPPWTDVSSVHITVPGIPERHVNGVRVHGTRLGPEFVEQIRGMRMTTPARTAIDLARGRTLPHALVCLDSAARVLARRTGLTDRDLRDADVRVAAHAAVVAQLDDAYRSLWGLPGTVAVREALAHVSLGSESPLESQSRGCMLVAGLPAPRICWPVRGASGRWYFADFAWPEARVLGEADGFAKYGATDAGVATALRAERARQHDLEDADWTVVRWDSSELPDPAMSRLRSELGRASLRSSAR